MREITTKVYTFDELNETAKEKAIEWFAESYPDCDWWESTYEDAENIGIKITEFDTDYRGIIKFNWLQDEITVAKNIIREHGETCETYEAAAEYLSFVDILAREQEITDDERDEREQELKENFEGNLKLCYLSMLKNELEYLQSREHIIETIQINEFEFTEDGRRA
jgi:hypothetical protein